MCSRPVALACVLASLTACKRDRNDASPNGDAPIISTDIRKNVCNAQPCGGDRPVIEVYRDSAGQVRKLYRLYGSCSHSPGLYFDPDGTQSAVVPEKPVVPGSTEAHEFEAQHQRQIGGLTKTDWIRCSDGLRLPPPK